MMYQICPEGFKSKFEIVSCFIEHDGEILLLHRQSHKSEGNTWGLPAGKIHSGEDSQKAIIREIQEETGLDIPQSQVSYSTTVYVRYQAYDFVCHIFHTKLTERQQIRINQEEHKAFVWASPRSALKLPLIQDQDAGIKLYYKL